LTNANDDGRDERLDNNLDDQSGEHAPVSRQDESAHEEELLAPGSATAPLSLSNLIGQQVGRYRIERQIGSGGVAAVYQAYDQVQGIPVALKVLLPQADTKTYSRFRREALTAGGLRYEHVVRILQVGTLGPGGLAYIAMELIDGESLAELLNTRGLLHPQESCNLLEPIARALDHAHRAGIVHRDVKPSNILLRTVSPGAANSVQLESLDHPVVPLLSDFGVARYLDAPELTSTGRTVGTPAYMAPEQCAGKRDVDGRADIYSLGCVLYRCVTGRLPFTGSTTQMLHAHVYEPLVIDHETMLRLPPVLVEILRRCLAKQPEDRYPTAGELASALAFAAGRNAARRQPNESEATATLTLNPSTPLDVRTPATSATVLVPGTATTMPTTPAPRQPSNPLTSRTMRAVPAANVGAAASTAREDRFYRLTWVVLPIALAVLVFAIVLAFIGSPFGLGRGDGGSGTELPGVAVLPSPTNTQSAIVATFTATAAGVGGTPPTPLPAVTATLSPLPPTQVPIVLPTSTDTPTPFVPTATWTAAPSPSETPTLTPTPTASPTLSPTATLTPSPTFTVTPQPTDTVVAVPTDTPTPDPLASCSNLADPVWTSYLTGLDPSMQQNFLCAYAPALPVNSEVQDFEFGSMLRLDNSPNDIYVYYNDGRWEMVSASWQEGEPVTPEGFTPGPDAFLPTRVFGKVWLDERIRAALGYATTPQPETFPGRLQSFPGGTLVYNYNNGRVYPFLADRRQ
jgi:serine/threonine-protein kinase